MLIMIIVFSSSCSESPLRKVRGAQLLKEMVKPESDESEMVKPESDDEEAEDES